MTDSVFTLVANHAHSAITHFPIALLIVSVLLDLLSRRRPQLRTSAWITLVLGTIGAVAATISGLIAHIPYEESAVIDQIELHQYLAFATTAIFVGLTIWRWRARQRDAGRSSAFALLSVVGLVVLVLTGFYGGQLVLRYGVGVVGVTP